MIAQSYCDETQPKSKEQTIDTGTPGTSREIYSEDADGETNSQPLGYKPAVAGKELSLSSWCIVSLYIYHFSTVIDFSSEKYSGSTGHRDSW